MPTVQQNTSANTTGRLQFIDNLRWVMIMLVVSMHAAVTYSHLGSWYYMEDRPVGLAESGVFGTYQAFLQSFFMGFLFFIAGYFVPGAYDAKGPRKFLRDRFFRLGLPLLLFVFFLQPFSIYCLSFFHGEDVGSLAAVYRRYLLGGRWIGGTGPLWFCEALLIFCLGYALLRVLGGKSVVVSGGGKGFPARAKVWGFIGLITVLTFLVRIPWPNGTSFYNLQFCYFPQYVLFFGGGILAFRGGWLQLIGRSTGKYWGRVGLAGGLILWVAILGIGGAFRGHLDLYKGGLYWQSLGMALWEQVAGVGISIYLLVWFREKYNTQGRTARFFSVNAFSVYVFHTPVLISISRMMSGHLHFPLLCMFLLLTVLGVLVTYAVSALVMRKIPLLKNIL